MVLHKDLYLKHLPRPVNDTGLVVLYSINPRNRQRGWEIDDRQPSYIIRFGWLHSQITRLPDIELKFQ